MQIRVILGQEHGVLGRGERIGIAICCRAVALTGCGQRENERKEGEKESEVVHVPDASWEKAR